MDLKECHGDLFGSCESVCTGSDINAEGAKELVPALMKLQQLKSLNLAGQWM